MQFSCKGDEYASNSGCSQPKLTRVRVPGKTIPPLVMKTLLVMKFLFVLLFAASMQVSARTYGQTVSFTGTQVPLEKVFRSIQEQTGFQFFYTKAILERTSPVSVDLHNVALNVFLDQCLKDQPLRYTITGKTIFLHEKEMTAFNAVVEAAIPPVTLVHGKVMNERGEPLVNANVVARRIGKGTVTDSRGEFTLKNLDEGDIIYISYIGYRTERLKIVAAKTEYTVVLSGTTNELDKLVVQAYGTTSQRLATGNIGVVRAEDISKQPVMNPIQAIQGMVAGAIVTRYSGYASSTIKIEIRGRNTINPNMPSDPLYIIDGVPLTVLEVAGNGQSSYASGSAGFIQSGLPSPAGGQSPFFSMNPNDIESIEILKDADATAIYGSRGANGVILITTKKGKAGASKFDVSVYTGFSRVPKNYHLLNTHQYIAMRKEALANDGLPVDVANAPDLVLWDSSRHVDWQKYLFSGTGKTVDAQASLSGGTTQTTFRLSGSYHYLTEIMASSGSNRRASMSLNLNHRSNNQRFNASFTGAFSSTTSDLLSFPTAGTLPPNAPEIFTSLGQLNYKGWAPLNYLYPFGFLLQPYEANTNFLTSSLALGYQLAKGLSFKVNMGYNLMINSQNNRTPIASQDPSYNPSGSLSIGNTKVRNALIEPQLEYNVFLLGGKLTTLAGASYQANKTSAQAGVGVGYKNDELLGSISNAPLQRSTSNEGQYKYAAMFSRITYNWKDKYIVNLNARRDGSTRFGPGRQFGNFGSFGAAWIFSEEAWMKDHLRVLSLGKIRGSYGTTGGDQIDDYAYLSRWGFSPNTYNGYQIVTSQGHYDSLLRWQVNKKLEMAVDLGFFEDRVTMEAVYYRDRCNNQLVPFPTPNFSGFPQVTSNTPANVQNSGWEFLLGGKAFTGAFNWTIRANIGINRNKLLGYPNISQSPYADQLIVGKSLNIMRLLHSTGVDPATGLYRFEDINKDNQVTIDQTNQTKDDRIVIDRSPRYDGGIRNEFSYKNFELSVFLYFKKQIGRSSLVSVDLPGAIANQPVDALRRWQKPGDITDVAKFTTNPYADLSYLYYVSLSDGPWGDASFLRLQNVAFSYSLPEKWRAKIHAGLFRIYVQAQNLFTITSYKGLDPEVQGFGALPNARTIVFGLSANF